MANEETKTVKKAPAKKTATKTAAKSTKTAAKKTTKASKPEVKEEVKAKEVATPAAPATKKEAKAAAKAAKAEAKVAKKAAKEAAKAKPVEEKAKPTSARCFVRDIRITPRKVRLVVDLVRGKSVSDALGILARTNRVAATPVAKAIKSAAANATNNFGMEASLLYVAEIQVSDGLKIKRFIPRAKGSASPIIKRNANLTVVVAERK
ncbi:MAG TPA: 50S ribosomal protein L22 [Candidatus Enteromonas pullicola]|uniref:Large ribosomal subunit protein uL22 n=1 Tax=Candidatus Alloenteromonas pullicola TaxID=2840784 RepID=A0A9D1LNG3_9FIRM|nr:50S ribosomal protein L22 [Candidatus Enteromonas pullicola]